MNKKRAITNITIGNISMDMTAILLKELDDIGDEVLIFGENHLGMKPITITSGNAKTISYEILTSIGRRVEFIYIK